MWKSFNLYTNVKLCQNRVPLSLGSLSPFPFPFPSLSEELLRQPTMERNKIVVAGLNIHWKPVISVNIIFLNNLPLLNTNFYLLREFWIIRARVIFVASVWTACKPRRLLRKRSNKAVGSLYSKLWSRQMLPARVVVVRKMLKSQVWTAKRCILISW